MAADDPKTIEEDPVPVYDRTWDGLVRSCACGCTQLKPRTLSSFSAHTHVCFRGGEYYFVNWPEKTVSA